MGSSACFLRCFNGAVVAFAAESVATVRVTSVWASSLAFLLAGIFSFLLLWGTKADAKWLNKACGLWIWLESRIELFFGLVLGGWRFYGVGYLGFGETLISNIRNI
jgi:hypothetical protein